MAKKRKIGTMAELGRDLGFLVIVNSGGETTKAQPSRKIEPPCPSYLDGRSYEELVNEGDYDLCAGYTRENSHQGIRLRH
ncbi:hypothetical protein KY337_00390 [Candidatus Woesearchaeota archaeon]|nr:hypothetical protein [Candidatus Woesearchaeota archaeon]